MRRSLLLLLGLLISGEILLRWLVDIKLYQADSEVGYWIAPDQSGGSLLTGSYAFNDVGFGVAEPLDLSGPRDLVLVGDSLVFGTSDLSQSELLGPTLERQSEWKVWPFATGSWGLANEIRALERIDLDGAEAIVFVINSEDVKSPSFWKSEYETPREEPPLYLTYTLQKFVPALRLGEQPIPVRRGNLEQEWRAFDPDAPVYLIAYDWAATTGNACSWLPTFIAEPTSCYDPIALGFGDRMLDGMHLNPDGNAALASHIEAILKERLTLPPSAAQR